MSVPRVFGVALARGMSGVFASAVLAAGRSVGVLICVLWMFGMVGWGGICTALMPFGIR